MHVIFRADANPQMGTGHIMRCLALAEALVASGAQCSFLCRSAGLGEIAGRIRAAGHTLIELAEGPGQSASQESASPWLPHGWQYDATACRQQLAQHAPVDWLVVDHYALTTEWESSLRPLAQHILVIDDLANRRHDCDLLLDVNLAPPGIDRYTQHVPAHCAQLLGPRYALLRPEFAEQRAAALSRPTPTRAARLLILFGGADRDDLTGKTLSLLAELGLSGEIDIVIGPLYAHQQALQQSLAKLPTARAHQSPENIATLMGAADLCIGSPGTTSWERCTLGLPCIAIAVADNQEPMAQILARHGAHLYLGRHSALQPETLAAAIRLLTENSGWRIAMRRQAADLCDGRGALRVARQMRTSTIQMRPASSADAKLIHAWRDDPRVRQSAFNSAPIAWESHLSWYESTLNNPERQLLLAQLDNQPIACVRFDLSDTSARISIFLDPNRIGQSLAIPVLRAAESWLSTEHPNIREINAEVLAANQASQQAFLGAGYHLDHLALKKTLQPATGNR